MTDGFSEHKVLLCLDKELYRAFIKLQADKDLGRSFAGLLPWVEGMYTLGYISEEIRDRHVKKYSVPLVADKPKLKCGFKDCVEIAVGYANYLPRNEKIPVCTSHREEVLALPNVWKILK